MCLDRRLFTINLPRPRNSNWMYSECRKHLQQYLSTAVDIRLGYLDFAARERPIALERIDRLDGCRTPLSKHLDRAHWSSAVNRSNPLSVSARSAESIEWRQYHLSRRHFHRLTTDNPYAKQRSCSWPSCFSLIPKRSGGTYQRKLSNRIRLTLNELRTVRTKIMYTDANIEDIFEWTWFTVQFPLPKRKETRVMRILR